MTDDSMEGGGASGGGSTDGGALGSTLYFGNLHPCVAVPALQDICSYFGPVEQVKVIKDKSTGLGAGYGFVKFCDRRCATIALQYLNNKVLYGQEMRVNWAFQSHQREDTSAHWHVFVGDLGQDVTDAVLFLAFSQVPGCSDARVMWDHATGRSKGYGFVAMRSRESAQQAIDQMHGQVIGSRRVRCGWAQHKQDDTVALTDPEEIDQSDPANTNVYVGNIAPDWSEADINAHFASFGPVAEVKLHKKGGYGFVRYRDHKDAVRAICETNTKVMCGRAVKCSWGKNASGQRQQQAAAAAAAAAAAGAMPGFLAAGVAPGAPFAAGPVPAGGAAAIYGLTPGAAALAAPGAAAMAGVPQGAVVVAAGPGAMGGGGVGGGASPAAGLVAHALAMGPGGGGGGGGAGLMHHPHVGGGGGGGMAGAGDRAALLAGGYMAGQFGAAAGGGVGQMQFAAGPPVMYMQPQAGPGGGGGGVQRFGGAAAGAAGVAGGPGGYGEGVGAGGGGPAAAGPPQQHQQPALYYPAAPGAFYYGAPA